MKRDTEQAPSGAQEPAPQGLAYLLSPQFAGVILRFLAVLRLLSLFIPAAVLLHFSVIVPLSGSLPTERFLLLALCLVNAPIAALLWAGAFAGKWRCLPVYVISEMGFCFWNLFRYYWTQDRKDTVFVSSVALFLVFFSLFIPLIMVRYYRFLRDQFFERKNQLYGRVALPTTESRLISPQSAGVVLRFVAVIRLFCLILIGIFMLQIINEYSFQDAAEPLLFMVLYLLNAPITALLWAGSFAEKRRCLPVYAICEIACSAWMLYLFLWMSQGMHSIAAIFFFGVPFLVFFGLYIPLIVVRYYRFLSERDIERKRHLYGRIEQS